MAQVAEGRVPGSGAQGVAQRGVEVLPGPVVDEAPRRAGLAGRGVEEQFGSAVVRLVEAVGAVQRDGYGVDVDRAAEGFGQLAEARVAAGLGVQHVGGVLVEPEVAY